VRRAGLLAAEGRESRAGHAFTAVCLSDAGRTWLAAGDAARFSYAAAAPAPPAPAASKRARGAPASAPGAPEEPLVAALTAARRQLAAEHGVAPFLVLSNASLRAVAHARPTTPAALRAVPGIGDYKCATYGRLLLRCVAAHAAAGPDPGPPDGAGAFAPYAYRSPWDRPGGPPRRPDGALAAGGAPRGTSRFFAQGV